MPFFKWDKAKENDYRLPYVDDIAFRQLCKIWGGGDLLCGRWIIERLTAHIVYADRAHPWKKDQKTRAGIAIANGEFEEIIAEFENALAYGLEKPDSNCIDEERLEEAQAHMDYEIGDTFAVFAKLLRQSYGQKDEC